MNVDKLKAFYTPFTPVFSMIHLLYDQPKCILDSLEIINSTDEERSRQTYYSVENAETEIYFKLEFAFLQIKEIFPKKQWVTVHLITAMGVVKNL